MSTTKKTGPKKTVLDKIIFSIRNQPQTSNGVSRTAIVKYLKAELQYDNSTALKQALKKGVSSGKLEQTGQSFRVKGDPQVAPQDDDQLEIINVSEGKGSVVSERGDTITVKYVGTLNDDDGNSTEFDSANSFKFDLGAGEVIKGWDRGLLDMKVGARRRLVVPPKLGYGKRGSPPEIPPNATLHFDVTMKKIEKA
mmetsp:Transcript_11606/g.17723  ORF Transcript_11606/g.17723 Transcript_11606/m.17723 type:complete len:196 (+) Transcript_11606:249-836(+)|eukprot:CAMPEP_0118674696 /NCGR_PEP_ID=MMETSP0800-20121206/1030_1 /TAXON_ID=210618 ORGANISM="Striatella unipunctata, Strain CCMP2910" /NCGR_SAMPLE_ID=MMETSP0800 /ASSEMBLY_ACC=CAM_ASM_000638 /LENGTH=195 /DNA_ID=CAMNT_0006569917 /DNA_START=257 /DNA_END=844 /DNA_ORIENTATION=-